MKIVLYTSQRCALPPPLHPRSDLWDRPVSSHYKSACEFLRCLDSFLQQESFADLRKKTGDWNTVRLSSSVGFNRIHAVHNSIARMKNKWPDGIGYVSSYNIHPIWCIHGSAIAILLPRKRRISHSLNLVATFHGSH